MRLLFAAAGAALLIGAPASAAHYVRTANIDLPSDPISFENAPGGYFGGTFAIDGQINAEVGDTIDLHIALSRALVFSEVPNWPEWPGFLPIGFSLRGTDAALGTVTFEVGGATGDIVSSGVFDGVERSGDKTPFLQLVSDPDSFHGGSLSSLTLHYTVTAKPSGPLIATYFGSSPEAPLSPIPEPTTWAMMIAGFGLSGSTVRRRRYATQPQ